MKTLTDIFPDESANMDDTPRRIVKSSLKMAEADNETRTGPALAGNNEDDSNESDQKKK